MSAADARGRQPQKAAGLQCFDAVVEGTRWPWTLGKAAEYDDPPFPTDRSLVILRKEVIQPQVLLRLPCYDLVPVTELAVGTPETR